MGVTHMRHGLDFVDLQNPKVRRPPVCLEQWIVIGAEMSRCAPTVDGGGVEYAADVSATDGTTVHADADEATRELVHDHEHPVAPEHDGLASKEVHAPQAVGGVSDERQPRGPGAAWGGAKCFDSTRYTTFLSMSNPNVRALMCAIRGQPNRGLRDLSSTMAWMSASPGPFGPGFLRHGLDENSRRYLRRTNAR